MANRKLSAKQIKAGFGGKRRQTAAKHKRKSSAASHRPRTKKTNAPKKHRASSSRKRSAPRKKHVARKPNLGGIFALTANPAKGHKRMAQTKKNKRRASSKSNAGKRQTKRNPGRTHHRRRANPGTFGRPMDWLEGGAGVLTGVVAARGLPQLVLGSSNTGPMGYAANAVATAIATFAAHMAFPRHHVFSASVLAGGVAAIISRVIGDYSLLGSYSSQLGLGDYLMNFNFTTPQYLAPGNSRGLITQGGAPASVPMNMNSAAPAGVSGYGPNLY